MELLTLLDTSNFHEIISEKNISSMLFIKWTDYYHNTCITMDICVDTQDMDVTS